MSGLVFILFFLMLTATSHANTTGLLGPLPPWSSPLAFASPPPPPLFPAPMPPLDYASPPPLAPVQPPSLTSSNYELIVYTAVIGASITALYGVTKYCFPFSWKSACSCLAKLKGRGSTSSADMKIDDLFRGLPPLSSLAGGPGSPTVEASSSSATADSAARVPVATPPLGRLGRCWDAVLTRMSGKVTRVSPSVSNFRQLIESLDRGLVRAGCKKHPIVSGRGFEGRREMLMGYGYTRSKGNTPLVSIFIVRKPTERALDTSLTGEQEGLFYPLHPTLKDQSVRVRTIEHQVLMQLPNVGP